MVIFMTSGGTPVLCVRQKFYLVHQISKRPWNLEIMGDATDALGDAQDVQMDEDSASDK